MLGAVLVIFALNLDSTSFSDAPSQEEMMGHTVLSIDGEEIKYAEYAERNNYVSEIYRNSGVNEDIVANMVASLFIYDRFTAPALAELGLQVSDAEINTYAAEFGQMMVPQLRMYGWPDDQIPAAVEMQWNMESVTAEQTIALEKFGKVFAAANYANRLEVEDQMRHDNLTFDGRYVMVPYTSLPEVEVTDQEIEDYYQAHRKENANYGQRTLSYVSFNIEASDEDKAAIEQSVMAAHENIVNAGNDTDAIKREVRGIGGRVNYYRLHSALPAEVSAAVAAGTQAPVEVNGSWKAYYVISDITAPATFEFEAVEANNIIEAEELAAALVAANGDFTQLDNAVEVITDSRNMLSMIDTEASHFIGRQVGDIFVHTYNNKPAVIKITALGEEGRYVLTADINKRIEASEQTKRAILADVDAFMAEAESSAEAFVAAATNGGYNFNMTTANRTDFNPNSYNPTRGVRNIANSRNIALWAYNAEVGQMKSFHGENVINVVMVSAVDNNRYEAKNVDAIKRILTQEKQYDAIVAELNINTAIEGAQSGSFTGVKFDDTTVDGKAEPALIGAIAAATENGTEGTVRGQQGVYAFVVETINGEVDLAAIDTERIPMMTQRESSMAQIGGLVLTSQADIEDFRGEGDM